MRSQLRTFLRSQLGPQAAISFGKIVQPDAANVGEREHQVDDSTNKGERPRTETDAHRCAMMLASGSESPLGWNQTGRHCTAFQGPTIAREPAGPTTKRSLWGMFSNGTPDLARPSGIRRCAGAKASSRMDDPALSLWEKVASSLARGSSSVQNGGSLSFSRSSRRLRIQGITRLVVVPRCTSRRVIWRRIMWRWTASRIVGSVRGSKRHVRRLVTCDLGFRGDRS